MSQKSLPRDREVSFEEAAQAPSVGIIREFWDFLKTNKKWWLLPLVIVLGLIGLLAALAASPAAPFIYPLF